MFIKVQKSPKIQIIIKKSSFNLLFTDILHHNSHLFLKYLTFFLHKTKIQLNIFPCFEKTKEY
jgi:hypothetical protein